MSYQLTITSQCLTNRPLPHSVPPTDHYLTVSHQLTITSQCLTNQPLPHSVLPTDHYLTVSYQPTITSQCPTNRPLPHSVLPLPHIRYVRMERLIPNIAMRIHTAVVKAQRPELLFINITHGNEDECYAVILQRRVQVCSFIQYKDIACIIVQHTSL